MTECRVEVVFEKACSNLLQNTTLNQVMYRAMQAIQPLPARTDMDMQARLYQATLTGNDIEAVSRPLAQVLRGQVPVVFRDIAPYEPNLHETIFGSTDVADVSWVTPTVQAWVACYAFGTPLHSWQMVAQGKNSLAHAGMVMAARTLTATAIELVEQPHLIAQAQAELLQRRGGKPYVCPIPADIQVPVHAA